MIAVRDVTLIRAWHVLEATVYLMAYPVDDETDLPSRFLNWAFRLTPQNLANFFTEMEVFQGNVWWKNFSLQTWFERASHECESTVHWHQSKNAIVGMFSMIFCILNITMMSRFMLVYQCIEIWMLVCSMTIYSWIHKDAFIVYNQVVCRIESNSTFVINSQNIILPPGWLVEGLFYADSPTRSRSCR